MKGYIDFSFNFFRRRVVYDLNNHCAALFLNIGYYVLSFKNRSAKDACSLKMKYVAKATQP